MTYMRYSLDEFDKLRMRWREMLVGNDGINLADPDIAREVSRVSSIAYNYWKSMNKSVGCTNLWDDLQLFSSSSSIRSSYSRIRSMAAAFCMKSSELSNQASLLEDILYALDWMNRNVYHESVKEQYDNWWDWNIGAPMLLNDCVVMLYDRLEYDKIMKYMSAVGYFTPEISLTGANRVWRATVVCLRGIIIKDASKIAYARDGLSQVFPYVDKGDGFYTDGSFIQHDKFPYNGGYGASLLVDITNLLYLLHESSWDITDPARRNVLSWIYDSLDPFIHKGALMDMVRGREISRQFRQDHIAGNRVIRSIIQLSQILSGDEEHKLKSRVKYWLLAETYENIYQDSPLSIIEQAKLILNDPGIKPQEEPSEFRMFSNMDRAVHIRPDFRFGISMYSSRIFSMESINNENRRGWYTSHGMTYLYNGDLGQYSGDFWPTVDAYRLPGITVEKVHRDDGEGHCMTSRFNWAGGTDIQGMYGACGMELDGFGTLTARKSWFMFDNEIVALGAGIRCVGEGVVETVIDNRRISRPEIQILTIDGCEKPMESGWMEGTKQVRWVHLAGPVPKSDIGYYFPEASDISCLRELRTGRWCDINGYGSLAANDQPCSNYFITLWITHGVHPVNASYAYVILPGKKASEVCRYADDPDVQILVNSPAVQAVSHRKLRITGANFWEDRPATTGGLTCDRKASVMMCENGEVTEVSVSDPTMQNTDAINIWMNGTKTAVVSIDEGIEIRQLDNMMHFTVHTKDSKGKPFKAIFRHMAL